MSVLKVVTESVGAIYAECGLHLPDCIICESGYPSTSQRFTTFAINFLKDKEGSKINAASREATTINDPMT